MCSCGVTTSRFVAVSIDRVNLREHVSGGSRTSSMTMVMVRVDRFCCGLFLRIVSSDIVFTIFVCRMSGLGFMISRQFISVVRATLIC